MLTLRKPSADAIRGFLATQEQLDFSYVDVGATRTQAPAGFVVDHTRVKLGEGPAVFQAAKLALQEWRQLRLGWIEVWPAATPIRPGQAVATLARASGLWSLNSCRIIYVVDESNRYGLAYGTLPGHDAVGEERFLIECDAARNDVWYDILSFSRPRHIMARLGYPLVRAAQKRFRRESVSAMAEAVRLGEEVRG